MLTIAPPADEAGFLGFAIADALLDLLVEKDVLTKTDATVMLMSVADRFSKSARNVDQRCANTIIAGIPEQAPLPESRRPHPIAEVSDLLQCCVRAVSGAPVSPIGSDVGWMMIAATTPSTMSNNGVQISLRWSKATMRPGVTCLWRCDQRCLHCRWR